MKLPLAVGTSFNCQWWEIIRTRRMNWVNFDFIILGFEYGGYKGRYFEATVAVLGLRLDLEVYGRASRSGFIADMRERLKEHDACDHEWTVTNIEEECDKCGATSNRRPHPE